MQEDSSPNPPHQPRLWLSAVGWCLLLAAGVGLFLLIRAYGETLSAPVVPEAPRIGTGTKEDRNPLLHVLLALAAVLIAGQLLSKVFVYVGQPPVIGEVVAGILLGPSLIGEQASAFVLPADVAPFLGVIAQLGVILYMFLVGLELNAGLLQSRAHATVVVSHASIIIPFVLGAGLSLWLYPVLSHQGVPFTSFALFLGVAMAITAFPVLARILTDRGMEKTELGVVALSCAAVDDVTAWCLLALVVGVAQAHVDGAVRVAVLALAFVGLMLTVGRLLAIRFARRHEHERLRPRTLAWVFAAVLLSALATEEIGIHAIFGAFLLGAVTPHDSRLARELCHRVQDIVTVLMLPAFFAYTGMRTHIGLVDRPVEWLMCGVIILVATAGKFGGTVAAARLTGLDWRTASALGVLMNTRGLMELIVLNVGLDLGVISQTLFAMMVMMALATTVATTPILLWLVPQPSADAADSHVPAHGDGLPA